MSISHVFQSSISPDICNDVTCDTNKYCVPTSNQETACQCIMCPEDVVRPVCASNGQTFISECMMKRSACQEDSTLNVFSETPCSEFLLKD